MTFLELRQRVAELAGLDQTQSDTDTRIKAWINQAYQQVGAFYDWPWLVKRSVIQTVPDITTGTISVTNTSTAITFSAAPSSSVVNQYMIKVEGSENWYNIASHTAASTAATLDVPFLGDTNGTATYILRKVVYSLPSDFDRMQFMRQTEDDVLLAELRPRDFFSVLPDPTSTSSPRFYFFHGLDTNLNWQIGLHPIPDTQINTLFWYFQEVTELSVDTSEPFIPAKFHNVLVFGALALYGYQFIDDTRLQEAKQSFANILNEMRKHADPGRDSHLIIQPSDRRINNTIRGPRFPSNFGPNFHS